MSTYYFLACDKCRHRVPVWGNWVGGPGLLRTAKEFPESVQDFIHDHLEHGIVLINEHDAKADEYLDYIAVAWHEDSDTYNSDHRPKEPHAAPLVGARSKISDEPIDCGGDPWA